MEDWTEGEERLVGELAFGKERRITQEKMKGNKGT